MDKKIEFESIEFLYFHIAYFFLIIMISSLSLVNSFRKMVDFVAIGKTKKITFCQKLPNNEKNGTENILKISPLKNRKKIETTFDKMTIFPWVLFFPAFLLGEFKNNKLFQVDGVIAANYSAKTLTQKLTHVPVFAVTNSTGQPYLASNSKGEQVGLIFFSHEDAIKLLKGMQKTHQVLDARIYIMGLDKAYKMVSSNATPSGIKGNHGQELKMVFRFYPDQKELKNANSSPGITVLKEKFDGIPVFVAEGLTIRKGKEDIIPIFFTKNDLENAWNLMCESNPDQAKKPEIKVGDLLTIIKQMENDEMKEYGFFPSNESIEFVKSENKRIPSAKIHSNSVQKF